MVIEYESMGHYDEKIIVASFDRTGYEKKEKKKPIFPFGFTSFFPLK